MPSDEFYDYENGFLAVTDPVPILQQPISKDVTTNTFLTGVNKPEYKIELGQKLNNFGDKLNEKIMSEIENNSEIPFSEESKNIKTEEDGDILNLLKLNKFSISDLSKVNLYLSVTIIDSLDDLLNKPEDVKWNEHINVVLRKKERLLYIGFLILIILLLIILLE